MEGPLPRHGVRHAGLDLTQGSPPPRTPDDYAQRFGEAEFITLSFWYDTRTPGEWLASW